MDYYIAEGTEQRGPFTIEQLREVQLRPETLVWRQGMPQWQAAQGLEELRPMLMAMPVTVNYAGPQTGAHSAPPYNPADSNRIAAGICGILLGGFGVHKFILGLTSGAVTMLAITLGGMVLGMGCGCLFFPLGLLIFAPTVMGIIGLIEGIIYLSKSDEEFHHLYVVRRRQWF